MLLLIIFINLIGGKWPNMDLEKQSEIQPKYEDEETRYDNIVDALNDIDGSTQRRRYEEERNMLWLKEYQLEESKSTWRFILCMSLLFISIFGIIIYDNKQEKSEFEAKLQENSSFRLQVQKIDGADICYTISPGKLKIYKKVIRYEWRSYQNGKVHSHSWDPYIDYQLLDEIEIPYHEGRFDKQIYVIEKREGGRNPNAPWYYPHRDD